MSYGLVQMSICITPAAMIPVTFALIQQLVTLLESVRVSHE